MSKWFSYPSMQGGKLRAFEDDNAIDILIDDYPEFLKEYQDRIENVSDSEPFHVSFLPPKSASKKNLISGFIAYWKTVEGVTSGDTGYLLIQLKHPNNEEAIVHAQLLLMQQVELMQSAKIK